MVFSLSNVYQKLFDEIVDSSVIIEKCLKCKLFVEDRCCRRQLISG